MKFSAAPVFGSDIGDGFGEIPVVAVKVASIVLAFAIRVILRFSQDRCPVLPCALTVTLSILAPNLNDVRPFGQHISFSNRDATLASFPLDTVIGDAEPHRETKCFPQPFDGDAGIRINEYRYYSARRDRSVESHLETLSLNSRDQTGATEHLHSSGIPLPPILVSR